MINHKIHQGLSRIFTREVASSDIGSAMSTDILDFLISTPTIIHMIIESSCELLDCLVPEDYVTVGKYIEFSHEKPTLIGENISLILTVEKIEGEKVFLDISVHDSTGLVGKGKYLRLIVNRDELIESAYARSTQTLAK